MMFPFGKKQRGAKMVKEEDKVEDKVEEKKVDEINYKEKYEELLEELKSKDIKLKVLEQQFKNPKKVLVRHLTAASERLLRAYAVEADKLVRKLEIRILKDDMVDKEKFNKEVGINIAEINSETYATDVLNRLDSERVKKEVSDEIDSLGNKEEEIGFVPEDKSY